MDTPFCDATHRRQGCHPSHLPPSPPWVTTHPPPPIISTHKAAATQRHMKKVPRTAREECNGVGETRESTAASRPLSVDASPLLAVPPLWSLPSVLSPYTKAGEERWPPAILPPLSARIFPLLPRNTRLAMRLTSAVRSQKAWRLPFCHYFPLHPSLWMAN
jgi:hypothetical protein